MPSLRLWRSSQILSIQYLRSTGIDTWPSAAWYSSIRPSADGASSWVGSAPCSRCSCRGDRRHLDVVFLKISARQYLRRAVDPDREVPDILVQPRRDKRAVERFLRKLLKALKSKIQKRRPGRTGPLRLGCVVASHIHIAHATHATHATTHAAATALVLLGQFSDHPGGREHQSRD